MRRQRCGPRPSTAGCACGTRGLRSKSPSTDAPTHRGRLLLYKCTVGGFFPDMAVHILNSISSSSEFSALGVNCTETITAAGTQFMGGEAKLCFWYTPCTAGHCASCIGGRCYLMFILPSVCGILAFDASLLLNRDCHFVMMPQGFARWHSDEGIQ